jgi:hypothetical protein
MIKFIKILNTNIINKKLISIFEVNYFLYFIINSLFSIEDKNR